MTTTRLPNSPPCNKWFIEYTAPSQAHMFGIEEYIVDCKTAYQRVEIIDTCFYGRCLILDGKIQSSEYDEYIYHEALVQPAMLMHPFPRRVLVIGGGEGATLREVLKHSPVEHVLMLDIDQQLVKLCKQHLPRWHQGSFDDPRVELIHEDARGYLETHKDCFDIIISDLPEPVDNSPCLKLYTRQFYRLISQRLNKGGILALQAGDFSLGFIDPYLAILNSVKSAFPDVFPYHAFVPCFNTDWGYILACLEPDCPKYSPEEIDSRIRQLKLSLRYYDGETWQGAFSLPRDLRLKLGSSSQFIDDDEILSIF